MKAPSRGAADGGYTLVIVLTMTALLGALLTATLAVSRPSAGLARLGADEAEADALIDAGFTAAAYRLVLLEAAPERLASTLDLAPGTVRIAAATEGGRVDLNAAPEELLASLFEAAGGRSMSGEAFAARIADWRDDDGDAGANGAEVGDYAAAGLGYSPANAPFQSVEELALLLGLDGADFTRIAPLVTVFGGPLVDAASAPRAVLDAIPGIGSDAARIVTARAAGRDSPALADLVAGHADFLTVEATGAFAVSAEARLATGYVKRAEAVVAASPDDGAPYRVLRFRTGL